jgi:hypothetical protein
MLKFKPSSVTPPDLFRFKFPDGYTIRAFSKDDWFEKIQKYATDNDYPLPDNWKDIAEDQCCRTLSGEWCTGGDEYSFVSPRFTFNDFLRGMKTLGQFVISGQVVSQEVAEARAVVCSRCVLNMTIPGCSSCAGMADAVVAIKGAKSTKYDHLLKACGICKCGNEAKVWLPIDIISKSTTPEMLEQYKRVEECWQKNELLTLQE